MRTEYLCNSRRSMSRWTPSHSVLLSRLLDFEIGTKEMVDMRKDLCVMDDCRSFANFERTNCYQTGSISEGLVLQGSDIDTMFDINENHDIEVIEPGRAYPRLHRKQLFMMVTENVHPAFSMLRSINKTTHPCIVDSLQEIDGSYYLSSYLTVHTHYRKCPHSNARIQGPSIEHPNLGGYGTDHDIVISIHCPFWPSSASEWVHRTRAKQWPEREIINIIVDFGFHLVPVGYAPSPKSMMEWRISFSIAEKNLVWSFNHIQVQMYAVLKLILKEFIKPNCSDENYVLCSYFIKTFLFWEFEDTDACFWKRENFRDCLMYLLTEFHKVLHRGVLKHYFIPNFNLLEVKLTQNARLELLQLFCVAIKCDIEIINKCKSLNRTWDYFLNRLDESGSIALCNYRDCLGCNHSKRDFIMNTQHMMFIAQKVTDLWYDETNSNKGVKFLAKFISSDETEFTSLVIRRYCVVYNISRNTDSNKSNKYIYKLIQSLNNIIPDLATGRLWTAILFIIRSDYTMALTTINKLLSSIPPYVLYPRCGKKSLSDINSHYVSVFLNSNMSFPQIAKRAWLFDFHVLRKGM